MDTIIDHIKAYLHEWPKGGEGLPIKTINKVPVQAWVSRDSDGYRLKIVAVRCARVYYCRPILLEELKDTINSLQYDSVKAMFSDTPSIDWSGLQCDNVEMDFTECCVCLSHTTARTDCGHVLCYPCSDQIKIVDDEFPCPLCRADVSYDDTFGH